MTDHRKIIHVDMDAFFASVEQLDNINLRGKPVVVGGSPENRGVVAAASYEARAFGVHSAMPTRHAYQLCPQAVFVPPRFARYKEISEQIMAIFREYTELVEPLSLDEAYLDVTQPLKGPALARELAQEIRTRIKTEIGLSASAGVASNKFLAKIASDLKKPDGLTVIAPQRMEDVLPQLNVKKLPGVGKVTAAKLADLGVNTIAELRRFSESELEAHFGKTGAWFYHIARGEDSRPVVPHRDRKSIGCEDTFSADITNVDQLKLELRQLARRVTERLNRAGAKGRTLTLKITYDDFIKITRSKTEAREILTEEEIFTISAQLLELTDAGIKPIRLLGLSLSGFDAERTSRRTDHQLKDAASIVATGGPFQLVFPFLLSNEH